MPTYKGTVEYIGSKYSGWQSQKNSNSIQQQIENSLLIKFKKNIKIIGASRTDAGVHALNQVFHFVHDKIDIRNTLYSLNSILPKDISIKNLEIVQDNFHSRYSAKSRSYKYFISKRKNIFFNNFSYKIHTLSNLDMLLEAQQLFLGEHNFKSFCKNAEEINNYNCNVIKSEWIRKKDLLIYTIEADRFIHGMVRGIVGCQIEYGLKKISLQEIENLINLKSEIKNPKWAPALGLFLWKIKY